MLVEHVWVFVAEGTMYAGRHEQRMVRSCLSNTFDDQIAESEAGSLDDRVTTRSKDDPLRCCTVYNRDSCECAVSWTTLGFTSGVGDSNERDMGQRTE